MTGDDPMVGEDDAVAGEHDPLIGEDDPLIGEYDAVVVGGGIAGASTAYHLARAGAATLLVDRDDAGRATAAGAGIVSPATSSRNADDVWFELGRAAGEYYPELVSALADEQGGPTGYLESGLLSVALADDECDSLAAQRDRTEARAAADGYPDPAAFGPVSPARAQALFPPLAEPRAAVHYRNAAQVDGRTLTGALLRAGRSRGLAVERGSADRIVVEAGAVQEVVVDGERVETDAVVVAGGAWSAAFGDDLGVEIPVEPERGQIVHLDVGTEDATDDSTPNTADWPIVGAQRGHYLVPWPGGRVVAGATSETGAGFDARTTAAGVREVLDEAVRVAPGLADAELVEARVGLRPTSRDRRPILGPVPGVDGAFVATGLGATGLTLGPYVGRLVAGQVVGREPSVDLAAFGVHRFG